MNSNRTIAAAKSRNVVSVSRRGFLKIGIASAAMTAADWRLWAVDEGLPAYYGDMLASVSVKVRRNAKTCADGFWFVTDMHIPSNTRMSGRIIAKLVKETGIRKVLSGGDMPEAFGSKASLDASVKDYRDEWVVPIERAGGEFYPAKGNHDFTIRSTPTVNDGFTYSCKEARDVLMDTKAVASRAVTNADDDEACYYYVDFPEKKMRYIVADTTDRITMSRPFWAVEYGMHERQVLWLAEHALRGIPSGWGVVVMHHIPICGVAANPDEMRIFAPWREILEAFQGRRKVIVFGRELDYSKAKGRILLDLTGHHHAERQSQINKIWHVTEPCDAAYQDYISGSKPWCPDLPVKERGTVYEQTFDAVQFDLGAGLIRFTRFGGGGDRALHITRKTVRVGESVRFCASLFGGAVSWGCYDSDRVAMRPNPQRKYDYFADYFNDVADISQDGMLTAKKAGETTVVALSPNGDKELFPVVVV